MNPDRFCGNMPLGVMFLILVAQIDIIQESITIQGITLFQISFVFLMLAVVISALVKPPDRDPNMMAIAIASLLAMGFVMIPMMHTGGKGYIAFIGNMMRIIIMLTVAYISADRDNMDMLMNAMIFGALITALFEIITLIFPNTIESPILYQHREYLRVRGIERDPNYAALKLLMALPFVSYKYLVLQGCGIRCTRHVLAYIVIVMGILLTGSRAAFGIMFFYIFVWNVYLYFRPIVPGRRASWYFINVAIMVIAVGYAYSQGIFERAMIHGETIYDIGEFGRSRRWDIAYGGIELFLSYPIFGIGPVDPGFHNTYIDMMACYGIVGTTPMCVLILVLFVLHGKRAFGRATKDDIQDVLVSFSVILSVIMWLMMGATIGAYRLLTIWVVCGIGLAVGRHRYSRNMVVVNGVNVK